MVVPPFGIFGFVAAIGWVNANIYMVRAEVARALLTRRCPGICLVRANLVRGHV